MNIIKEKALKRRKCIVKKRLVILGMICTMMLSCTACSNSSSTLNSTSNIDYGIANVDMTGHNSYDTYDGKNEENSNTNDENGDTNYENSDTNDENSDTNNENSDSTNVEGNSENEEVSTNKKAKNIEDKLVYSYNVEYSVYGEKNKKKAIEKVDNAIEKYDGFIENSTSSEYNCRMTVRIPSEYRDKFVDALTNKLDKENYTINKQVENLKSTYADYKRQYEIAKSNYEAYSKLLKQADMLNDVLEITNYVNTAKQTMDDMERQMQDIDTDVAYSTITVDISFNSDDLERPEDEPLINQAIHAFKNGIRSFFLLIVNLLLFIIGNLLYLLVFGLIIWFIVTKRKKKKRQKQERNSAVENKGSTSEVETITVDMNEHSK